MDTNDIASLQNSAATFSEVLNYGKSSPPLNFPDPQFAVVTRVNASVHNPATNEEAVVPNVFYEVRPDGMPPRSTPGQTGSFPCLAILAAANTKVSMHF